MTMARCRLFRKSVTSSWPSVPRRIKVLAVVAVTLLLILVMIVQSRKTRYARMTYDLQESVNNIFDVILEHMKESESKDFWRPLNIEDSVIFSAYLDDRPEIATRYKGSRGEFIWAVIRIIAIMPFEKRGKDFQCVYKYDTNERNVSRIIRKPAVNVQAIRENWNMKYSAFFVLCELSLPKKFEQILIELSEKYLPTSITTSVNDAEVKEESFVKVHYPRRGPRPSENSQEFLAVCVPVFHHGFDRPLHLIEFIEYHRMLGADHFTFYNSSISSNVDRVLRYYNDRKNVAVLPWDLPPTYIFERTLRVHGIFAALNDCLYRSSFYNNCKYVANVDADEFIVPRKQDNLTDMIKYLESMNIKPINHAGYIIRNAFFYDFYDDDDEGKEAGVPYLLTQAKTKRVMTPNDAGIRSKYIVRAKDVVELGNHVVWEYRNPSKKISKFGPMTVDQSIALLHHYRACETEMTECTSKETVVDKTAHRFTDELGRRVSETCNAIFGETGCFSLNS